MIPARDEFPFKHWLLDAAGQVLIESKHKSEGSLYTEICASQSRIERRGDPASRMGYTGPINELTKRLIDRRLRLT